MAWDINGPEVKPHDRKENLCKKDVFLADWWHGTLNDSNHIGLILSVFFVSAANLRLYTSKRKGLVAEKRRLYDYHTAECMKMIHMCQWLALFFVLLQ